jgi:hypothetical protein
MRATAGGGFSVAVTYDHTPPGGKFDLITCFETLEHMPDPVAGMGAIVAHLDELGLVLFSPMLRPADFERDELVVCRPALRAHLPTQPERACQGLGPARLPHRLVRRQQAFGVSHATGFRAAFWRSELVQWSSRTSAPARGPGSIFRSLSIVRGVWVPAFAATTI